MILVNYHNLGCECSERTCTVARLSTRCLIFSTFENSLFSLTGSLHGPLTFCLHFLSLLCLLTFFFFFFFHKLPRCLWKCVYIFTFQALYLRALPCLRCCLCHIEELCSLIVFSHCSMGWLCKHLLVGCQYVPEVTTF